MDLSRYLLAALLLAPAVPATADDPKAQAAPVPVAEAAARLTLPEGFRATLFAGEPDVVQPIAFTIDPKGRLWVAECHSYPEWSRDGTGHDRILIFEDTDGDGRHDSRKVFYDKGVNLSGLELGFGGVYVCSTPNFLFIPDRDGDDVPDGEPEVLLDGWSLDAQHNVFNGLTWGPDGWLYGCNGILSASKIGAPGTPDAERVAMDCGVWRFHPTTRRFEVVASGTTNPWGLDFDADGEMFITNCVIPHLFHVVPGAHYERMFGQDLNPHVYELLKTCADHVHWDTREVWSDIRRLGVTPTTDVAGGGHAHVGAMIYLGDNWPDDYRGDVFTCNVHGHRVNRDTFRPDRSTVVATHRPDFLLANDAWFRGLELQYGPDGGVFITDWSDTGECHEQDADGAHRENGRILKVTFGTPEPVKVDLAALPDADLVKLLNHKNEWYGRTARRLLMERAARDLPMGEAGAAILDLYNNSRDPGDRLRALWAYHAIDPIGPTLQEKALSDPDPSVRAWGVRLSCETRSVVPGLPEQLAELASVEPSPRVRLHLASILRQLIPGKDRWIVASALAAHQEDADDPMIPLMVWYGVEPLASHPSQQADMAALIFASEMPTLRRLPTRRIVEADVDRALTSLLPRLAEANSATRRDVLDGILGALRGRRSLDRPDAWPEAAPGLLADADPLVRDRALRLGLKFGDPGAAGTLRAALLDTETKLDRRLMALDALVAARAEGIADDLRALVGNGELSGPAIRALAAFDDNATPRILLDRYKNLTPSDRADAVSVLAARPRWADALLSAIESGEVSRRDLPVALARQILAFGDADLSARLGRVWGTTRPTSSEKAALIARYKDLLAPDRMAGASASRGREVFARTCASCHTLFGEGGDVGPELTGSDRRNLDYILENVLDPSASVGRDYKLVNVATADGRLVAGIVREQDDRAVLVQTANERLLIPRDEIEEFKNSEESMMPEGLLQGLTPEEVRDLAAYLAATGPPADPKGQEGGR
jgi:putative membrane-bound dehydrogenase-like protein